MLAVEIGLCDRHHINFELGDVKEGVGRCTAYVIEEFDTNANGGLE